MDRLLSKLWNGKISNPKVMVINRDSVFFNRKGVVIGVPRIRADQSHRGKENNLNSVFLVQFPNGQEFSFGKPELIFI